MVEPIDTCWRFVGGGNNADPANTFSSSLWWSLTVILGGAKRDQMTYEMANLKYFRYCMVKMVDTYYWTGHGPCWRPLSPARFPSMMASTVSSLERGSGRTVVLMTSCPRSTMTHQLHIAEATTVARHRPVQKEEDDCPQGTSMFYRGILTAGLINISEGVFRNENEWDFLLASCNSS